MTKPLRVDAWGHDETLRFEEDMMKLERDMMIRSLMWNYVVIVSFVR